MSEVGKIELTENEKQQVEDMNKKLAENPQEYPIYDGKDVHIIRWYDGKQTWFCIILENASINIEEKTFEELQDAFEITTEKRKLIISFLMGMLTGEKGNISYSDFSKRFSTLMGCYGEMPKFNETDIELFKLMEKIHLMMVENIIDLLSSDDISKLPDMAKLELIKLTETLHLDIEKERAKRSHGDVKQE